VNTEHIDHVHETPLNVAWVELTPPHDKRRETAAYQRSHKFLVEDQDKSCVVCGVRRSTLGDPTQNKLHSTALETHHFPIEWSLMDAVDPLKVHRQYSQVIDRETLEAFIDSPANLLVLCDICHRSKQRGIHHLLAQDFAILPFLLDDYIVVADQVQAAQAEAHDEAVLKSEATQ
jgi:hypothetical protein